MTFCNTTALSACPVYDLKGQEYHFDSHLLFSPLVQFQEVVFFFTLQAYEEMR